MTGAQSDSIGTDARGLDPAAGGEFGSLMTPLSQEVGSVFGSNANECAASGVGSVPPSSDGAIYSGSKARAAVGALS